ncbi:hypothetical protein QYF36_025687 [Acer negundo]|nr:hypothetical protein QYF36_025687 [Acer negundo]
MRTSSPPKKRFYRNGSGKVEHGRRYWREGGYGVSGPSDVARNQENWRTKMKPPEPNGGRTEVIRTTSDKENLETLTSMVACGERNSCINDDVTYYTAGENPSDDYKMLGPKVTEVTEIVGNHKEQGQQVGVEVEISITDQNMLVFENVGLDPSKGLATSFEPEPLTSPSPVSGVRNKRDFGPPGFNSQLGSSSEERISACKHPKEGASILEVGNEISRQKNDGVPELDGKEIKSRLQVEMEENSRNDGECALLATDSQISAGRSLPTSRMQ